MSQSAPLLLTALLFVSSAVSCAFPKSLFTSPTDVKIARASIARLTGDTENPSIASVCTAFAVAPKKFVTANHCLLDKVPEGYWGGGLSIKMHLEGREIIVLRRDEYYDLALIMADLDLPSMIFYGEPVELDQPVKALGYANGRSFITITNHTVMKPSAMIQDSDGEWSQPGIAYSGEVVHGMSGGPIIDSWGRVVGIVQIGGDQFGFGVDAKLIVDFLTGE